MFSALLDGGRVHSVFQPIVELPSGRLYGYELLARASVLDAEARARPAPPDVVLELSHGAGRLRQVDACFRHAALDAIAGHPTDESARLHVNIDLRAADDPAWDADAIAHELDQRGIARSRVVLEITEACPTLHAPRSRALVERWRGQGMRVALDDVGAGYATLAALAALRPDIVKLDASWSVGLADDPLRRSALAGIVERCDRDGAEVIAEGIECVADAAALVSASVRFAQGYLFGRPAREPASPCTDALARVRRAARRHSPIGWFASA